jgi:hypothetical protein
MVEMRMNIVAMPMVCAARRSELFDAFRRPASNRPTVDVSCHQPRLVTGENIILE